MNEQEGTLTTNLPLFVTQALADPENFGGGRGMFTRQIVYNLKI